MCGIFFTDTSKVTSFEVDKWVKAAAATLEHRGPDASRTMSVGPHHHLVFHRLAIMSCKSDDDADADGGMQPFTAPNGFVMVCNGEIYNYRELADMFGIAIDALRSDVDIILHMLENVLNDADEVARRVSLLDGDFAFVITDGTAVVSGRDPYGVRPLFYLLYAEQILSMASEAKALLCFNDNAYGGGGDVSVFPPGHVLVGGKFLPYLSSSSSSSEPSRGDDLLLFRELLECSVEKRVRHSERPVGLLCSGGVDSAVMTAIAAALPDVGDLRVFTMQYGTGRSDDAFYATLMCSRLGLDHEVVTFDAADVEGVIDEVVASLETCDPNTIRAAIPMYLLARHIALKTDVKVILSGEGADELLGGYGYFRFAPSDISAAAESDRLLSNLHMFDLLRADRCFAAFGLEVRVPFLDANLVQRGVPAACRRPQDGVEKQLLRNAFAHLDVLADCRILERPKEKFSDGTGFCYVPDLLRMLAAGRDDGTLKTRLVTERERYEAAFMHAYGDLSAAKRLVVERRLPEWADVHRKSAGDECVHII